MRGIFWFAALFMAAVCLGQQPLTRGQATAIVSSKNPGLFSDLVDGVGALPARSYAASGPSSQAPTNATSTFTGWSTTIGVPVSAFNFVDTWVPAWDAGAVPTVIEVVVRDTTNTGTILATGYAGLSGLKVNIPSLVRVNLNTTVSTGDIVVVQWITDGHLGEVQLDSPGLYPNSTYPQTQYCTNTNGNITTSPVWQNEGAQYCKYVRYGLGPCLGQFDDGTITNTFAYTNATETAYGGPCGSQLAFNRAEFDLEAGTTAAAPLPTTFRCRFRISSSTGTILGDKVLYNIPLIPGQIRRLRFDFPAIIQGSNLWVELLANGRFAARMLALNTYPTSSYAQAQYQTYGSVDYPTWANDGAQHTLYFRASLIDWADWQANGPDDFAVQLRNQAANLSAPFPLMTRNLYGITGLEEFVSLDGALGFPLEHESIGSPASTFRFTMSSTKGTLYSDRWAYTPVNGDAGTATMAFNVYNGGVLVQSLQPTLNFCTLAAGTSSHKVLTIGDSTSGSAGAGAYWLAQLVYLSSTGTGTSFTEVGANLGTNDTSAAATNANDSTSTNRNIFCETWPGQTLNFFVTGLPTNGSYNSGHGPFYIGGSFSISSYLSNNSITMSTNDWFLIDMGTNDVINSTTDAAAWMSIATYLSNLSSFITSCQSAVLGCRIGLMLPPAWAGQDGFAYTYGNYAVSAARARRNRDLLIQAVLFLYDNATQNTNKIWVIPTHLASDPANDFETTTLAQGEYNSVTRTIQSNAVHMASWGYYRKAATVYAFLKNMG
ncbi:MAG: hypothetical protein P4L46_17455 [Fimbriimonas sp.]|nr:hypothetical protein [Fimbriimonas sp.]